MLLFLRGIARETAHLDTHPKTLPRPGTATRQPPAQPLPKAPKPLKRQLVRTPSDN